MGMIPTVPHQGHKDRVPAEPRRDPAEPSRRPAETDPAEPSKSFSTLWEASFLGEPRGGLCTSDGEPSEL